MTISLAVLQLMDGEPGVRMLWLGYLCFGLIALAAGWRVHPLAGILGVVLMAVYGWSVWGDLRDPFVGPDILASAGETYPMHAYASMFLGILLGLSGTMLGLRDRAAAARLQRARARAR